MLLLDTDVLVDYLRKVEQAVRFLEGVRDALSLSVVSVAELYSGARGEREEAVLETLLSAFHIFPVNREVAEQGGRFRQKYFRSHGIEIPDALIAATCVLHHAQLVTLNRRHYPMIGEVMVPYRKQN